MMFDMIATIVSKRGYTVVLEKRYASLEEDGQILLDGTDNTDSKIQDEDIG